MPANREFLNRNAVTALSPGVAKHELPWTLLSVIAGTLVVDRDLDVDARVPCCNPSSGKRSDAPNSNG